MKIHDVLAQIIHNNLQVGTYYWQIVALDLTHEYVKRRHILKYKFTTMICLYVR